MLRISRSLAVSCRRTCLAAGLIALSGACGDGAPLGPAGAEIELTFQGLRALDPAAEGSYELWMVTADGTAHSAGRFTPQDGRVVLSNPVGRVKQLLVTVEPPGDADATPSPQVLLRGEARGGRVELRIEGAVTAADLALREKAGQYTVFSPSDNHKYGYPSNEYAGIWLLNSTVISQGIDQWVRLTPLKPGWVYEGWMVRDLGSPGEVWMSYGKFTPSNDGAVNRRDHNGWGPFSGVDDYVTAGAEDYPGDDWVSNPFGFPVPGGLPLPIDFREKDAAGEFRWSHVITIEPEWNLARGEAVSSERPFLLQPYRDRFIDNGIGRGRPITLRAESLPSGEARVVR